MKKLNMFFFGAEVIHPLDSLTFYGILGGSLILLPVMWVVTL